MKTYNKLVRDNIPQIIEKEGLACKTRVLDMPEYKAELLKKLVEESREALEAGGNMKDLMKEFGDVQEVMDAIIKAFGLNPEEIERVREVRRKERGAFRKKIFLESTDE